MSLSVHTLDKLEDLLVLVFGLGVSDEVDLVLEDDDVFELHDLNGRQMLRRLGLWTRLVARYKHTKLTHLSAT